MRGVSTICFGVVKISRLHFKNKAYGRIIEALLKSKPFYFSRIFLLLI